MIKGRLCQLGDEVAAQVEEVQVEEVLQGIAGGWAEHVAVQMELAKENLFGKVVLQFLSSALTVDQWPVLKTYFDSHKWRL